MDNSQPTQPSTQHVLDPRRLGRNNSGLNNKDITEVIAILHPASPGAIKIVEDAAERRPEHVLFRNAYDSLEDEFSDIEEQETIIINRLDYSSNKSSRAGADLALRMSSKLKNPSLGFVFGRNHGNSDIIFGQDTGKRISNQHFRIYLNADAVLMLEDMSTNGTIVDDVLLKNRDLRFNKVRMLGSGSIICIQNSVDADMIKFIVRVPSRLDYMEQFQENVRGFMKNCYKGHEDLQGTVAISYEVYMLSPLAVMQSLANRQFGGATMKWDGGTKYNIIGV